MCSTRVIRYYLIRVGLLPRLLAAGQVISKCSEFARIYGCEFCNVLSRGTQYKVESVLNRLLRISNFLPFSPSRQQVFQMKPPEYIPLILGFALFIFFNYLILYLSRLFD